MTAERDDQAAGLAARLGRLELRPDAPLVVVGGSKGAGRTTLLRAWFEAIHTGEGADAQWFTVQAEDDDPEYFSRRIGLTVNKSSGPQTIFIDDFQELAADSQHVLLDHLGRSGARGDPLQFAVGLRGRSGSLIGGLRATNTVWEVTDDDLRLSRSDIEELIDRRDLRLRPGLADQVATLTEGWALGVTTVLDYLERNRESSASDMLERAADELASTMVAFVDSALGKHEVEFLTQTSVLETLTPESCAAVADPGLGADLIELERDGAFVISPDRTGQAVRLHHLLRRGLRNRLAHQGDGSKLRDRHQRAAAWHDQQGLRELAIEHYLAAKQEERAADVLARQWADGRTSVTERHLAHLAPYGLDRYVPHLLTTGLVRGDAGNVAEVVRVQDLLIGAEWSGTLPHGFANLEAAKVELEFLLPNGQIDISAAVVETLSGLDVVQTDVRRLVTAYAIAHHCYYLRRFADARRHLHSILVGHLSVGRHTQADRYATVLASDLSAVLDHDSGRIPDARRHLAHGNELAASYDLRPSILPVSQVRELARAIVSKEPVDTRIDLLRGLTENGVDRSMKVHAGLELIRLLDQDRRFDDAVLALEQVDEIVDNNELPALLADRRSVLHQSFRQHQRAPGPSTTITTSERSVLHLLAEPKLTQAEIGQILGLSINTVKSHLRSVYQKFGIANRQQALEHAADLGLLATVRPWNEST